MIRYNVIRITAINMENEFKEETDETIEKGFTGSDKITQTVDAADGANGKKT